MGGKVIVKFGLGRPRPQLLSPRSLSISCPLLSVNRHLIWFILSLENRVRSGLARTDGWPQPPGSAREGAGDGLVTLGLCVREKEHLSPKAACLWGQGDVCPQTPGAPQSGCSGEGSYRDGPTEVVALTLADSGRRSDKAFDSWNMRRKNIHACLDHSWCQIRET